MIQILNSEQPPKASARDLLPQTEDLSRRAVELFQQGLDCQEAVMTALEEVLSLGLMDGLETQPKRRSALSASGICGALVGAPSVLLAALAEGDGRSANLTLELLKGFREKHGTITCKYLTRQMKWGDYHAFCSKYVATAVEELCAILRRHLPSSSPA